MQDVKVSVFLTTYNHEKYIKKALESIVTQKTNFKFEVLVHDDASTDSTASVIKEYAIKYPDLIFPIFQTENQYSKGVKIVSRFLLPYAKGEYIARLEGDDYWCDENKLQLMVNALTDNNATACIHRVKICDRNKKIIGHFPSAEKLIGDQVVDSVYAFQLAIDGEIHISSMLIKKTSYQLFIKKFAKYTKDIGFGDIPIFAYIAANEKLAFIDKDLSVYNSGVENSYMTKLNLSNEQKIAHYQKSIEFFNAIYNAFPLFNQKKIIKKRLELEEYLLQVALFNYKVIFAKENKELFKTLAFKHRLKLKIGRVFPSLIEKREKKKQIKG